MSEVDERLINTKINSEIKKYEILKKSFLKLYESEQKASKGRLETFDKINNIQEYDNTELKEIYNIFSSEMKSLEKDREIHLKKIMDLILPVTDYYPEKLKKSKKSLEVFVKVRKNKINLEKSRNNIKNEDVSKVQEINGELVKSRNEERNRGENLENEVVKFESERVDDNKCLFLHFIHSELKYHAAALEKLSKLFHQINEKEPLEELEKFANKLHIEIDFKNDLGIDIEKIQQNKEKRENNEKSEINDVYGDKDYDDDIKKSMKKSEIHESNHNEMNTAIVGSQDDI
jgi:hypothetical protein